MADNTKISLITASSVVDSSTKLLGCQTVSGLPADRLFSISQIAAYLASTSSFPIVVSSFNTTLLTSAYPSLVTYSVLTDSTYQIGSYLNIISISGLTIKANVSFYDENNILQIINITSQTVGGYYNLGSFIIKCKVGTQIIFYTTSSGVGTIGYDIGLNIQQLS